MLRILLVGQNPAFIEGLSLILNESDLSSCKLEIAVQVEGAMTKVVEQEFDLLVLDLEMKNTNTLGFIVKIKDARPALPILTYSKELEYIFIKRYLTSGARGYCFLQKNNYQEIIEAIYKVASGKIYISPAMVELIVSEALSPKKADRLNSLDEREFEILTHLVRGETLAGIARIFAVHTTTIDLYKSRILDKLRIRNISDLKSITQMQSVL
ncbi:response regulator [Dyadobacter psychrotolerans]|uniref:Response regulator transcription factor n=1 Tax=Dyadobacter psychrotolerans TaxID=2541721 RepID=A0A4V2Z508_9BACT|nr:response regulator transcription factor [Dyadobacter psychrotolerans]TDE18378.1 response regulator transcription factor [Dyadobacter psychrotolerans]